MAGEEKMKHGMSRKDALRAVRLERGSPEVTKEVVRSAGWESFVETCWQDLRFAVRMLRKSPGFTAMAAFSLAVGLAANTAIFSVINGVLLQPLEYPNPSQLVAIELFVPKLAQKFPMVPVNPAAYLGWSTDAKSLAGIGLVEDGETLNLTSDGEPKLLSADAGTANLFNVLGGRPFR